MNKPYEMIQIQVQWHAAWGYLKDELGRVDYIDRRIFPTKEKAEQFLVDEGWRMHKTALRRYHPEMHDLYLTANVIRVEERNPANWMPEKETTQ